MKQVFISIIASLLFISCHKDHDQPDCEQSNCKITKITAAHPDDEQLPYHIATFTYNQAGLPERITFNYEPSTAYPEYYFTYDDQNRLLELLEAYDGKDNYEAWHLYKHDNQGRIISDTTYHWGSALGGDRPSEGNYYDAYVHTYKYDAQNRVTMVSQQMFYFSNPEFLDTTTYYTHFTYNAEGNLGDNYSTAFNINTTSPVFQFVNGDYSKNSLVQPTAVNQSNLPLKYVTTNDSGPYIPFFFTLDLANSEIEYDCEQASRK